MHEGDNNSELFISRRHVVTAAVAAATAAGAADAHHVDALQPLRQRSCRLGHDVRLSCASARAAAATVPAASYRVALAEDGALQWHSATGHPPAQGTEPHTTAWSRALVRVLQWLPIEGLL